MGSEMCIRDSLEGEVSAPAVQTGRERRKDRREGRGRRQHDADVSRRRRSVHQSARRIRQDGDRVDPHERLEPRRQRVRVDEDVGGRELRRREINPVAVTTTTG